MNKLAIGLSVLFGIVMAYVYVYHIKKEGCSCGGATKTERFDLYRPVEGGYTDDALSSRLNQ